MQIGKLVRNRIPEIIKRSGKKPIYRILDDAEYKEALEKKLDEEVAEWHESKSVDELVDILDVMSALCFVYGVNADDLTTIGEMKNIARGNFSKKIFLEEVIENV